MIFFYFCHLLLLTYVIWSCLVYYILRWFVFGNLNRNVCQHQCCLMQKCRFCVWQSARKIIQLNWTGPVYISKSIMQCCCGKDNFMKNCHDEHSIPRVTPDEHNMADILQVFFKGIFFYGNVWISCNISPKYVPNDPMKNSSSLAQVMPRRRINVKPLSKPRWTTCKTHIGFIRPQWLKNDYKLFQEDFASTMKNKMMSFKHCVGLRGGKWLNEILLEASINL